MRSLQKRFPVAESLITKYVEDNDDDKHEDDDDKDKKKDERDDDDKDEDDDDKDEDKDDDDKKDEADAGMISGLKTKAQKISDDLFMLAQGFNSAGVSGGATLKDMQKQMNQLLDKLDFK